MLGIALATGPDIGPASRPMQVQDYLTSDLKQELVRNGRFGELAFVATQTDILEASEIADNLGLPPGTSKADCARARNAYTKRRVLADFYLGVETDGNPQAAAQADSCRQQQAAAAAEGGVAAPASVYGAGTYLCLPPGEPESSGGGHWGEWRALPCDTNPAVSVLRWTDDGAPVAATPCSLPPPAAEGDVAGRQGALAWQRPAAAFRLPVVTASAVDFQKVSPPFSSPPLPPLPPPHPPTHDVIYSSIAVQLIMPCPVTSSLLWPHFHLSWNQCPSDPPA